jgi:hypothetical protein
LAGIGKRWLEMERATGIEYIALAPLFFLNHGVTRADELCVRFLCEKHRHASQLQPWHPFSYRAFHRFLRHLFAHQMVLFGIAASQGL